jgi:hypothetical protein
MIATIIGHEKRGESLEYGFSAETSLWLAFSNRAELVIQGHIEAEDETEDVERGMDRLRVRVGGHDAIHIAVGFPFAGYGALVDCAHEWKALKAVIPPSSSV